MKNFFKILSGRPKNGNVVEYIKPFIFFPQLIIASIVMYQGFTCKHIGYKLILAIIAIIFAWQAGWGMSIERFVKSENKN
ncbi:MAG: hypothetical protein PHT02_00965 [Tissierellia bacterium]|nr:hypothetical protein [Tissierellia bacterium]